MNLLNKEKSKVEIWRNIASQGWCKNFNLLTKNIIISENIDFLKENNIRRIEHTINKKGYCARSYTFLNGKIFEFIMNNTYDNHCKLENIYEEI